MKILKLLLLTPWHDRLNLLASFGVRLKTALYYRLVFGSMGRGSRVFKPLLLSNPRFVHVGAGTLIRTGARIEVIVRDQIRPPKLLIGNNVNIEQNVHIVCSSSIVIGDNVTITGNCAIVDTVHPFQDVEDPRKIGERIDPTPTPVTIGAGTFVGIGTVILPNVRIGKNCVIGANSTVMCDVPDFCVASGNPARIILRYDPDQKTWI